jgi:hypothetical protein
MRPLVTMRDALSDPTLLADAMKGDSWHVWRVLLIGVVGEELTPDEREVWREFTGRDREPGVMADTFMAICGRRSGKSTAAAVLAVYLSTLVDWSDCLSLGERGTALYLAPTVDQSRRVFKYATTFIQHSPVLKKLLVSERTDSIELANRIDLEIQAANWRSVRGVTCVSVVLDEVCFLRSAEDSSLRDEDLIVALRPALSTTDGLLMGISSPGTEAGVAWSMHKRHYGPQGDPRIVVVQADSQALNPRLSQERVDRAYSEDAVAAESEYGAKFRAPTSMWLPRKLIEAAVTVGVQVRPYGKPPAGCYYTAFVDAAGGEGKDSFALCIGHRQQEMLVVDLVHEIRPPFNSETAVKQIAELLKSYGVRQAMGDAYAKGWPLQAFARHGIEYGEAGAPKSDMYLHAIPLFTASRVQLVDVPRLVDQLAGLRRKVGQGGRETVDHFRGAHDDLANCVAGWLWRETPILVQSTDYYMPEFIGAGGRSIPLLGGVDIEAPRDRSYISDRGLQPGQGFRRFDYPTNSGGYSDYALSEIRRMREGGKPW